MRRLDDKVAVVTGGGSGIGAATAVAMAAEGARVLVVDVDSDAAHRVAEAIGGRPVIGSVGDPTLWHDVVAAARSEGGLDVVHLNAGLYGYAGPIDELPLEIFDATLDVNIRGVVLGVAACVGPMEESGGGSLVATASVAGIVAFEGNPLYTLTKQAVTGFVLAQAPALAGRGISFDAVCPGIVDTPMTSGALGATDTAALGIDLIDPRDVAAVVLDLATSEGTGRCVAVQAGLDNVEWAFPTWRNLLDAAR